MDQKRNKNAVQINKNKLGIDIFPMYQRAALKGAVPLFYHINTEVSMHILQRDNMELPKQINELTNLIMKMNEGTWRTQDLILPENREQEYITEQDVYDELINQFLFFKGDNEKIYNMPIKGVW